MSFSQRDGFDSDLIRATDRAAHQAEEQAVYQVAKNTQTELRRIVRRAFGTSWRVWNAKGFAASIHVKKVGQGVYKVYSTARYAKGRTDLVDLLWVFDNAPTVRSGKGKAFVAVPIKGAAPIHPNGRRVMWPSEALYYGWQLEVVPIPGKNERLVLGRRNNFEKWRPLYVMVPSTKMPKRVDLEALYQKHSASLPEVWGQILDRNIDRAIQRYSAAA